jgi:hypothetical protein
MLFGAVAGFSLPARVVELAEFGSGTMNQRFSPVHKGIRLSPEKLIGDRQQI